MRKSDKKVSQQTRTHDEGFCSARPKHGYPALAYGARSFRFRLAAALAALLVCVGASFASQALGESESQPADFRLPTDADFRAAIEGGTEAVETPPLTGSAAARELPHRDLDRDAALELLQEVFEPALDQTEGVFGELEEPEKFLGSTAALVSQTDQPTGEGPGDQQSAPDQKPDAESRIEEKDSLVEAEQTGMELNSVPPPPAEPAQLEPSVTGNAIVSSNLPLKAPTGSGIAPIDLDLVRHRDGFEPKNSLVPVNIPDELGDAIELPGPDIAVTLEGAPSDRASTSDGGNLAFYPNVSTNTDFAVAAAPTGFETLTQLRGPDSPRTQTLALDMKGGDRLEPVPGGGARVMRDGDPVLSVGAPTAIDADGDDVPVEMTVDGPSLRITVFPETGTAYPVLVDPLFQAYDWTVEAGPIANGISTGHEWVEGGWPAMTGTFETRYGEQWSPEILKHPGETFHLCNNNGCNYGNPLGLYAEGPMPDAQAGGYSVPWDRGSWIYTVPRFFSDQQNYNGAIPTSYIARMVLSHIQWKAQSNYPSPYALMGLYSIQLANWTAYATKTGLRPHNVNEPLWAPEFPGYGSAVAAYVGVQATEAVPVSSGAYANQGALYVGGAFIELGDDKAPQPSEARNPNEGKWFTNQLVPVEFGAADTGLGVQSISAFAPNLSVVGRKSYGCTGVGGSPCPRIWQSEEASHPLLEVDASKLSTGVNVVQFQAEDPVGNKSAAGAVEIKVDHTAPQISLTGTATEQAAVGTRRPTYRIKATATDGTTASPQSGAAKEIIEFDGVQVQKVETGCDTQNCSKTLDWTVDASKYSAGAHTIKVVAIDAVGNSSPPQELKITLNPSPPTLTLSGTMTEQQTLGMSRPRYGLKLSAAAEAAIEVPAELPIYKSFFGFAGTANGQFARPADVAVDAKGNLWVPDQNNNRLQMFNEAGGFMKAVGSAGTANGQFIRPKSIAFAADGSFWVADSGNSRLQQFNANGVFLRSVGVQGSGDGQFYGPEGVAIDATGNIWVADTYNNRVQVLNPKGEFLKVVNPPGLGAIEPTGLDVGPSGHVWVADWAHDRVVEFNESGALVRQIGSSGSGNGQFNHPHGITVDGKGHLWVGDQGNGRIQAFNLTGEFLSRFGQPGTGAGSFGSPSGIATDTKGMLWIADTNNNRIQKWRIPGPLGYLGSIGLAGTGNGQFSHPADVAFDGSGNFWVVDRGNNRIQKFNEKGVFVTAASFKGSSSMPLRSPSAVAVDPSNNVWVADTANNRIVEFNEGGLFVAVIGKDVNRTKVLAGGSEAERNYCTAASGNVCVQGSEGTAPGQLKAPQGVAVTSDGSLWVADTGHNRLEKFSPTGVLLSNSFTGEVKEPTAVAMGPGGSIWAADSGNNRIIAWNSKSMFLRAFGSQGIGHGQFKHPSALEVDSSGNVWVGDEGNNRVQVFAESGEFTGKFAGTFGAAGSGNAQLTLSAPMGVALGNGNFLVTDTDNNRVQKWQPPSHSEVSTEITIDGKPVDSGTATCGGEHCPLSREWVLDSSAYVGNHTIVARATDGLGNATTKTLNIDIQPDASKPTLETGGSLVNAPEGWVEQEDYGITASAADAGYGVTSLALKIDGQQVAGTSGACPNGGCDAVLQKTIDMAPYSGGSHPAEVVATDGAGNHRSQSWTINVNPDGHITSAEAIDTLEAADETSGSSIVAPTSEILDPKQIEAGDNPGLAKDGSTIESTGVPNTTTMTTDSGDGFTIETPEGEITITPTEAGSSTGSVIAEGAAAVSPNTGDEADTVIRPKYNGDETFEVIRSATGQSAFSWYVDLQGGRQLQLISPEYAQVLLPSGVRAFLITAETAHDAVGAPVPTALSVEGNVLTLNVDLSSPSIVYPVRAGQGWEGGYRPPTVIQFPEDEQERLEREQQEREEREAREREEEAGGQEGDWAPDPPVDRRMSNAELNKLLNQRVGASVPAPAPAPSHGAGASVIRLFETDVYACSEFPGRCNVYEVRMQNGYFLRTSAGATWTEIPFECVSSVPKFNWRLVLHIDFEGIGYHEPYAVLKNSGKQLYAYCHYQVNFEPLPEVGSASGAFALIDRVYPNGFQEPVIREIRPRITQN